MAQQVDRLTIEQYGIHAMALMEQAARCVADVAVGRVPGGARVAILIGKGNNGGDAAAVARLLADRGFIVRQVLVFEQDSPLSDGLSCQLNTNRALGLDERFYGPGCLSEFAPDLIIDGIFGVGFRGSLKPGLARSALVEASKLRQAYKCAIDLPSGLDADSGNQEAILSVDETVTFGGRKPVHILAPGRDSCGVIHCYDIGFPHRAIREVWEQQAEGFLLLDHSQLLTMADSYTLAPSAHKYDRGHVLVIGGSSGKWGAPLLAAGAALRAGAGWVSVSMPSHAGIGSNPWPELTFEDLYVGDELHAQRLDEFLQARRVKAVIIGPGSMRSVLAPEVFAVLDAFACRGGFCVVDAGCLDANLVPLLSNKRSTSRSWLLTPHPGEWKRLVGEIHGPDALGHLGPVFELVHRMQTSIIYKSATPVIIVPELRRAFVHGSGTNILARAGSGDVAAGIAAAMGLRFQAGGIAAAVAQSLLIRAALASAEECGAQSVLATDLISRIGKPSHVLL